MAVITGRVALIHDEGVDVQWQVAAGQGAEVDRCTIDVQAQQARLIESASSLHSQPMASKRWRKVTLEGTARKPKAWWAKRCLRKASTASKSFLPKVSMAT